MYNKVSSEGIKYVFLGKNIENSTCHYNSLKSDNLEEIKKNHLLALAGFYNKANKINVLNQIHSAKAIFIEKDLDWLEQIDADGLVTKTPGVVLGVLTADCVPLILMDKKNHVIGALHAGYKGAFNGIIQSTLNLMRENGAKDIDVIIGPSIKQRNYEVGPEYYQMFIDRDSTYSKYFIPSEKDLHFMFDLTNFVVDILKVEGVNIFDVDIDTYSNKDIFFSYRRYVHSDKKEYYAANISMVVIENNSEL